jgi:hypothetical protein
MLEIEGLDGTAGGIYRKECEGRKGIKVNPFVLLAVFTAECAENAEKRRLISCEFPSSSSALFAPSAVIPFPSFAPFAVKTALLNIKLFRV